jgi:signal transduction histidine kinase
VDGDSVKLLVADTGIGVPAADIPKIFDEFYRGQNAREFAGEGTGLGLSIVNAIVAAHRGTIEVTSELGKGTTFAVSLPRHA